MCALGTEATVHQEQYFTRHLAENLADNWGEDLWRLATSVPVDS